eukprot:m.136017 g.136017  ORF g.136017 m.136017 type:complete len:957 (+) comp14721_c0_seq3:106-2976(+)
MFKRFFFLVAGFALSIHAEEQIEDRSCGTHDPDAQERMFINDQVQEFRVSDGELGHVSTKLLLKVVFHVIHKSDGTGKLSASVLKQQIAVLNEAFQGSYSDNTLDSNLRFHLSKTNYISNDEWFSRCKSSSYTFRPEYNEDSKKFINIYSCSGDGYLGWTWLPWSHAEGDSKQALIINYQAFPGGAQSKYNLGYTIVHEMGHYLGLLHTFQRGGTCTESNDDGVDDTPYEASPGSSCTSYNRDTCPANRGMDPLWSFMDYSYDRCMLRFSNGQVERMRSMMLLHRPNLVRSAYIGTPSPPPSPPPPTPPPPTPPPPSPPVVIHTTTTTTTKTITTTKTTTRVKVTASVKIVSVGYGGTIIIGEPVDVLVQFQTNSPEPAVIDLVLRNSAGQPLGSAQQPINGLAGYGVVEIALLGANPETNVELRAKIVRSKYLDLNDYWAYKDAAHAIQGLTIVAPVIPHLGPDDSNDIFDSCGDANTESECRFLPPFNTYGCKWIPNDDLIGGTCYPPTFDADMSKSYLKCGEFEYSKWQTSEELGFCSGSVDAFGACFGVRSQYMAQAYCEMNGLRLCSQAEMETGLNKNTGCSVNQKYSWTSTRCPNGLFKIAATGINTNRPPICISGDLNSANTYDVHTRCCADFPEHTNTYAPPSTKPPPVQCHNYDYNTNCGDWATQGRCVDQLWQTYMWSICPFTCQQCGSPTTPIPVTAAPTTTPKPAVCTGKILSVKNKCEGKEACCPSGTVCAPKKPGKTPKCFVMPMTGKDSKDIGELCDRKKHCLSNYCDKKGLYGPKWTCSDKTNDRALQSQADENTGDNDSKGNSNTDVLPLMGTVIAVVCVGAVIMVVVVRSNMKRSDSVVYVGDGTSSVTKTVTESETGSWDPAQQLYATNPLAGSVASGDNENLFDNLSDMLDTNSQQGGSRLAKLRTGNTAQENPVKMLSLRMQSNPDNRLGVQTTL